MKTGTFSMKLVASILLMAASIAFGEDATDLKFAFAPGETPPGYRLVGPGDVYSSEAGFGFEPGSEVSEIARGSGGFATSDQPFYFSAAVPEGNYNITLVLGDANGKSDTTLKAELRRLMLNHVQTQSGQIVRRTITVNVRRSQISGDDHVHLKPREETSEAWAWDDKLTLEFNGSRPCLDSLEITTADVPTVYLLGDSTVCDQPLEPWNSWGQMLTAFFKPGIAVSNQAESGETADGSIRARRLAKVLSTMRPGDYLFVQFGHNDMKEKGPGIGAFTSYTDALRQYVDGARAKGAFPVLVTSMNRKTMDASGHITNSLRDYPDAVRKLAKDQNVPLIDLNALSKTLYEAIGSKDLSKAFVDGTHHNAYGSFELAKCVVQGIKDDHLEIAKFIVDDFAPFDPARPDPIGSVIVPASPKVSKTAPAGN